MDLFIKDFCANNLLKEVMIQGDSWENILFRASDIGELLEIVNIRVPILKYDDTEKQIYKINSSTGPKNTIFFTEKGIHTFLFNSKKPIAKKILFLIVDLIKKLYSFETKELHLKCENSKNLLLQNEAKLLHTENERNIIVCNNKSNEQSQINENSNTNYLIKEILYKIQNIENKLNSVEILEKTVQNLEKSNIELKNLNQEILHKLNSIQTKTTTGFNQPLETLGPRLQRINPENLTLNKVYESIAECLKEYNFKVKRPSIVKAINENTIYHGYRWLFIDRNQDPNIISPQIENTKITRPQNNGYIAKLNGDKTEILNVYLDRKTAATRNGYKSNSALDTPVKNGTLANGYMYILYENCEDELKEEFVEKHGEPILYKNGVGQYDCNWVLEREFICKYDCIKQLKLSDKTLAKTLDKDIMYINQYFKTMPEKYSHLL
jgi:hypothetical protein